MNAVHLRSAIARAEGNEGATPGSRGPSEATQGAAKKLPRSQSVHDDSDLRSFAIEDGEALETALADSQLPVQPYDEKPSPPSQPALPADSVDYVDKVALESLDAELYEAELSSLQGSPAETTPPDQQPKPASSNQSVPSSSSNIPASRAAPSAASMASLRSAAAAVPVSYTHLTLPTILLV